MDFARRLASHPNALVGAVLLAVVLLAALAGLLGTPHDPLVLDFARRLQPPSLRHPFGTDEWGRDVLSRVLVGASTSVLIAFATVLVAVTSGLVVGALSGFLGGWVDRLVVMLMDAVLAFPSLLMALSIMVILGPSVSGVILALGIAYMPPVARLVRGTVLSVREKEFVEASRALGNGELYTLVRHVVPNCLAPLIVLSTLLFGWVILSESALSFLGLGVPPPAPTWGNMLAESREYMLSAAWLGIFPGLCISLALLGVNLLGDGLRDRLDPRMSRP